MKKFCVYFLVLTLILVQTFFVLADSETHATHFVALNGSDSGDCLNTQTPCNSIKYAIDQAAKASHVHVATGEYEVAAENVVHFLGDKVPLMPGFTTEDGFAKRDDINNPVTLVGIPAEFREQVEALGFKVVSDTKGLSSERISEIEKFTETYQRVSQTQKTSIDCVDGLAGDFPCNNVSLLSQLPLPSFSSAPSSASDIWGHVDLNNNKEYALIGLRNGTAIVDVSDPESPLEVATIGGRVSTWRDIKVYQYLDNATSTYKAYAYVTTEANDGLQIIDLNDLPNTASLANTQFSFQSAHNIYISNIDYSTNTVLDGYEAFIYITGSNQSSGAFQIYDLLDPLNPALVTSPPIGTGYVHDATSMSITDARTAQCVNGHNPCELFIDFNESTVDIWDMTDKNNPFRISTTPYSGSQYTHSGWYSADKNYVFIQDELDEQRLFVNTTLHVLDIKDLTAPTVTGIYVGSTKAIDHNGFTLGDSYYMSNYRRGLTILDVTDPQVPDDLGFFDTFPSPVTDSANFDGAWGTYPFLPSGNLLVSDINNGLFVLKEQATIITFPNGKAELVAQSARISEDSSSLIISINRTGLTSGELTINYLTEDASATAGTDFDAVNGSLTWADGETASKSVDITISDDADEENDETFNFLIQNTNSDGIVETSTMSITISANDAPEVIVVTAPSSGGGGSIGLEFLVLLLIVFIANKKRHLKWRFLT